MIQDPSLIVSEDVEGAPVRIGEQVKIAQTSCSITVGRQFLGHTGTVVALVYDDPDAQYPEDPLIQVRVEGLGEDLFFREELELPEERSRYRRPAARRASRSSRGRSSLARAP